MKTLCLPAPSLQRHLARTIDAACLTSVPDEYTASPRSEAAKSRQRKRAEREWRCQNAQYAIHIRGAPHGCHLWIATSCLKAPDGSINHVLTRAIASSEAAIKRHHRAYCRSHKLGKEINIITMCLHH